MQKLSRHPSLILVSMEDEQPMAKVEHPPPPFFPLCRLILGSRPIILSSLFNAPQIVLQAHRAARMADIYSSQGKYALSSKAHSRAAGRVSGGSHKQGSFMYLLPLTTLNSTLAP